MSNRGAIIKNGDSLKVGDWLLSNNGMYCAYLHDNGLLNTYNAPQPDASGVIWSSGVVDSTDRPHCAYLHNDGCLCIYPFDYAVLDKWIWQTHKRSSLGPHCMCLHDDGDLCIYPSEWPVGGTNIWASGGDPILEVIAIDRIDYRCSEGGILGASDLELHSGTFSNNTSVPQSSTISWSTTISDTRGWSISATVKIGVSCTVKESAGVPQVCSEDASITVSAEVCDTYTWNGSNSVAKTISYSAPINIPPHSIVRFSAMTKKYVISVPFTVFGQARLNSGAIRAIVLNGVYEGTNAYGIDAKYDTLDDKGNVISSIVKKL